MESGHRVNQKTGAKVPRMIIYSFVCTYNGKEVFASDWEPAISANPYMAFYVRAEASGTLEFTWKDDSGAVFTKTAGITVE